MKKLFAFSCAHWPLKMYFVIAGFVSSHNFYTLWQDLHTIGMKTTKFVSAGSKFEEFFGGDYGETEHESVSEGSS